MVNFKKIYRILLVAALGAFLPVQPGKLASISSSQPTVTDWAGISSTPVQKIEKPSSIKDLQSIVKKAVQSKQKIAICGAGYSQGGQTAYDGGITINMRKLSKIVSLDVAHKKITVQAGVTWQQIQEYIDPYNLSIATMQSYYNFSVGGSLSVNVHGRANKFGQLIDTVESIKVVLADGSLVIASQTENSDLFNAAIGGYGYMGIIVEATLVLTDNCKVERQVHLMPVTEYKEFFFKHIHNNDAVVLHNGNLYPNDFNQVMSIAWHATDNQLTTTPRLNLPAKIYPKELITLQIVRRVDLTKKFRAALEYSKLSGKNVAMRNYVMADDTHSLEPLVTFPTSHILQEYFIPCHNFDLFVDALRDVVNKHGVNVLNCSIRFVKQSTKSLLTYAPHDCFSFVLYINILNTHWGKQATAPWTQELIDHALALDGTFYLPYQLSARKDQVWSGYPNFTQFLEIKKQYDPQELFCNELFRKYA